MLLGEILFSQVTELLFASKDAVENDVPLVNATHQLMRVFLSFRPQRPQTPIEGPMRFEDHTKIHEASLKKELQGCYPIKKDTIKDGAMHPTLG